MHLKQTFNIAILNLRSDKTYFWQTMLGITLGAMTLMIVLIISQGVLYMTKLTAGEFNPNVLRLILQTKLEDSYKLKIDDLQQMVSDKSYLFTSISPAILITEGLKYENKLLDGEFAVYGVSESFNQIMTTINIAQGRWLLPMDVVREQKVCIIGNRLAVEILGEDAIGKSIKIQGDNYTVVGILQNVNSDLQGVNDFIFIPYTNARKLSIYRTSSVYEQNSVGFDVVFFTVTETADMQEAYSAIREVCQENMEQNAIAGIMNYDGIVDEIHKALSPIIVMLGFVSIIIILTGGTGIMNVMLLAVSKRTPEIGVRKAFGATYKDIVWHFIGEAACISVVGGLLGVILGLPLGWVACKIIHVVFSFAFVPASAIVSFAIAVGLGIFFGVKPARQAAKMEIVDAINSD